MIPIAGSSKDLNNDLNKIRHLVYQWKIDFNSGPKQQVQEEIFTRKSYNTGHASLTFISSPVQQTANQTHLGMTLDNKLDSEEHLKAVLNVANNSIETLRKLQNKFTRALLTIICKSTLRPYHDYDNVIYDQFFNSFFHQKLRCIQYNAALALTGEIRGTSTETLYKKLRLESLQQRRWFEASSYLIN